MKQVQTQCDTMLYVQVCKSVENQGNEGKYYVALTLETEVGTDEDGSQTTLLSAPQVDELIKSLQTLQYSITRKEWETEHK